MKANFLYYTFFCFFLCPNLDFSFTIQNRAGVLTFAWPCYFYANDTIAVIFNCFMNHGAEGVGAHSGLELHPASPQKPLF
ncbi:hypothetical protein BSZ35_13250 [Salinibacter sp. 10B]|nr:hypothetical protein BSZ35_13250 [Salinibacter sp. 10B]